MPVWLPYVLVAVVLAIIGLIIWALVARRGKATSSIEELRRQAGAQPAPGDGGATSDLARGHVAAQVIVPELDTPEATGSRMARLRGRLARSGSPFGTRLLGLLSRDRLTDADWDQIEETLLGADVGIGPTEELIAALKTRLRVEGAGDATRAREVLRSELTRLVGPELDRSLNVQGSPAVFLVIGVNGTGKTTTIGKLSRVLVADGKSVILGAADTFRAAAGDQLATWGSRVGVKTVRSDRDGADPAAIAFEAVKTGKADGADIVIVDTAGRLHNSQGLMDELGKIVRVIKKEAPIAEVLLVLDATTGQNGLQQA
jgi:fused signal recognition particle receptor